MKDITDEAIVIRVQSGDAESFAMLVERYEQKMLRYTKRFLFQMEDTEDLVQEVFLKAFVNIKSVDTTRKFSSWLYRIAHNESINALKKRKKEPVPFFDPASIFPHPVSKETAETEFEKQEIKTMIDISLEKLPATYREPLILYYIEELSYKEIADITRLPISTVGVRIRRAKDKLKKIYESSK